MKLRALCKAQLSHFHLEKTPPPLPILLTIKLSMSHWPGVIFSFAHRGVLSRSHPGVPRGCLPPAPVPLLSRGAGCRTRASEPVDLPARGALLIRTNLHAEHQYDSPSEGFV